MHSISRYIAALVATTTCIASQAQDLSTEITVDRIVEPGQTRAARPALMPQLLSPKLQAGYPKAVEWLQPGTVTPLLTTLGVARWQDSIAHARYRGYLRAGYLPAHNYGADAGYRFIDTERAWLAGAFHFGGLTYKRDGYDLSRQEASLEACGGFKPNDHSLLRASVTYRYGRVQEPYYEGASSSESIYYTQNANDIGLDVGWLSQSGRVAYDLGASVDHFAFAEASPAPLAASVDPLAQTLVKFSAGAGLVSDEADRGIAIAMPRKYGADVDGALLNTNNASGTLGLWRIRPYARFGRNDFKGRVGLGLSLATGAGTSMQFSPELNLAYGPLDKPFAASLVLTGGKEMNELRHLFAVNPYLCPVASYGFSRVLMDLEATVVVGPVAGFQLEAFGAFALPREWLMPALTDRLKYGGDLFAGVNAESTRLGARMKYSWRSLFTLGVSAEMGHSEDGLMTWYRWRDSAKRVYAAWADIRPIAGLEINLRWDLRQGRSIISAPDLMNTDDSSRYSLGDASSISAGASYAITPQLTASLTAQIHNKHLLISTLPAPTLTGLAALTYKF